MAKLTPRSALAGLLTGIIIFGSAATLQPPAFADEPGTRWVEQTTDTPEEAAPDEGAADEPAETTDSAAGETADGPAASVEPRTTNGPVSARGTQRPVDRTGDSIAGTALRFVGYPYRFGGASPAGFDCSGLVVYVLGQHGISIGRSTFAQWGYGTPVALRDALPGDLIFFANTYTAGISHVGIYIGNGQFVDAESERTGVRVNSVTGYWASHFAGVRRVR